MSEKDGGPAFASLGEGHGNPAYHSPGMSLRDWFAGQALAGFCANPEHDASFDKSGWARTAYVIADAMLKARSLPSPPSSKEGE